MFGRDPGYIVRTPYGIINCTEVTSAVINRHGDENYCVKFTFVGSDIAVDIIVDTLENAVHLLDSVQNAMTMSESDDEGEAGEFE